MGIAIDEKCILSIIIPVYNRQETFNSLMADLSQAITNNKLEHKIEVIVIDDASSVPLILPAFPSKLICERNQKNSGAPYSRARGLKLSLGKFIHFHDSDDSISDSWLIDLITELTAKPDIDILVTGRVDFEHQSINERFSKFFNKQVHDSKRVLSRLIYWNYIGPIGGVTFSRKVLESIKIRRIASCQDWQMYIDAIKNSTIMSSRPDIQFMFHKTGDDRISHNPRKKILGHLQLAKQTHKDSIFGRHIRLFYLYACKQHIYNKGGFILAFYKKHQLQIFMTFLVIAAYSFMPRLRKP